MNKKYKYIILVVATMLITSCSNFLDEDSREKIESEDQDVYSAEQFLTGVYGQFNNWDYAFSYLGITEILSDNADKGSTADDTGSDKGYLDQLSYTASTAGSFGSMWTRWYKAIGAATNTIAFIDSSKSISTEDLRNRYIGEAKFLRALNYFFLVRGWGDVPYQEIEYRVRAPKEDIYAHIEDDLEDAVGALPLSSQYSTKDIGRATKGAAQGLLSKVYLYQSKWQQAYDNAQLVIASNEYELLQNYGDNWKQQYNNSKESVFEIQAKSASDGTVAQGIPQYSEAQGARGGDNPWGWGFNSPSENLLNAYNAAGDSVRRDATIIFSNTTLWDGRTIGATQNPRYNYKAYTTNAPGSKWNDRTIKYMRFSEVLLIKAEAANELGKTAEALQALNQVRERVGLKASTTTNQSTLREEIWNERRLELAMEHDRWFDLIRTGKAAEAMRADGKNFIEGKHNLFPIPNTQMLQTPEMEQNPNW